MKNFKDLSDRELLEDIAEFTRRTSESASNSAKVLTTILILIFLSMGLWFIMMLYGLASLAG